jgi:hypothetical protein
MTTLEFTGSVFDATRPHQQVAAGVSDRGLRDPDDYSDAHRAASYAWALNADALAIPSAARKGSTVLVVKFASIDSLTAKASMIL